MGNPMISIELTIPDDVMEAARKATQSPELVDAQEVRKMAQAILDLYSSLNEVAVTARSQRIQVQRG